MKVLMPRNVRLWRIPPCEDYESLHKKTRSLGVKILSEWPSITRKVEVRRKVMKNNRRMTGLPEEQQKDDWSLSDTLWKKGF
jgi:hypothetical protein